MSAEAQIKSFVDRVLRLKEEQDVIGQDIRDIYAEAKSLGFDKTQLGNVVSHLRKVEKKGRDAIDEGNAIFDMYLAAYEGTGMPVATRAHTHEAEPHDPETGEILESVQSHEALGPSAPAGSASDDMPATVSAPNETNEGEDHAKYDRNEFTEKPDLTSDVGAGHVGTGSVSPAEETNHHTTPAGSVADEISATDQPETANEKVGGFPVAAAPYHAEETGALLSTRQGAGMERGIDQGVTAGETASNTEPDGDAIGGVKVQGRLPDAAGVEPSPSEPIRKSTLRPLCRYPGEDRCAGYGSVTCHACLRAAREDEVAA